MVRGFISGIFWGLIVSGIAAVVVSIMAPQPPGREPPRSVPQVEVPATTGGDTTDDPAPADPADVTAAEGPSEPVGVAAPPAPDAGAVAPDATDPGSAPVAAGVEGVLPAPETPEATGLAATGDEPVLPSPQAPSPALPEGESDLVISTEPAQPPAPVVVDDSGIDPSAPDMAPAPLPEAVTVIDDEAAADPAPTPDTPAAPAPVAEAPAPSEEPEPAPTADPEGETAAPTPGATPEAPAAPRIVLSGEDDGPRLQDAVPVLRPGGDGAASSEEAAEAAAAAPEGPAMELYAAPFDADPAMPRVAVILVDDGSLDGAAAAVAELPVPVTVAVDPTLPDAGTRMAAYRAAGIEVLALARLPEGAAPTDVAVVIEATFAALPETVGLLDAGEGQLQVSADLADVAMSDLSDTGRGVVTVSQGLNTALRAADRAGVPGALVYRDLDGEGQDATVIRRFLDQAAFRARQTGEVVLMGRVRPDTLSALALWGQSDRADQVALAPITAIWRLGE